ncbi:outer membrane beta-barrel protein [bacterium]|nr:outer membrane beta-barrel protein [bacterium]
MYVWPLEFNYKKGLFYACILLLPLILSQAMPGPVFAVGNIHFGSVEIHPFFSVREGYSSNVSLDRRGEEVSSGYRVFTPGIRCDWKKTQYNFKLSYLYDIRNYDKEDIQDRNFYRLDTEYDFMFGKSGYDFDLDGKYTYRRTTEPATAEEESENRKEGNLNLGFKLNVRDRLGFGIYPKLANYRYDDFDLAQQRDRDVKGISAKASIKPFTRTGILFEYGYAKSEYINKQRAENDDSRAHSLLTGLEWDATAKLEGAVKAGYQWKEYIGKDQGTGSPETWKVAIDLTHRFTDFTSFRLDLERSISDSTYKTSDGQEARYYYSNGIQFGLNHSLTYKVSTSLKIKYDYSDYTNVPRNDQIWQFDLGLGYKFLDWISAQVSYQNLTRECSVEDSDAYDYKSYQFNLGLNLVF